MFDNTSNDKSSHIHKLANQKNMLSRRGSSELNPEREVSKASRYLSPIDKMSAVKRSSIAAITAGGITAGGRSSSMIESQFRDDNTQMRTTESDYNDKK